MSFARRVFLVAGVYGLLVLLPQYFTEAKLGRDFPPPITHPEHYYGFLGVGVAWQLLFLLVARDPLRYRLVMLPSMLEKLTFGGAAVVLFFQGRIAAMILVFGLIDTLFALLFLTAFLLTRAAEDPRSEGSPG